MAFTYKTKRLRFIFFIYWILLVYIVAALVWWFIALNKQNRQMASFKREQLKKDDPSYYSAILEINETEKRKTAQYIGEGGTFFLLIIAGAVFLYRAVRGQFKNGQQQQHFIMAVTHELKTPIAVTKLNLETLQKRKLEETQQQRLIQNTLQEANRLNALCTNMLLASQIEAGGYRIATENIDLSELTNSCVQDFSVRFPQRMLEADIQPELYINGDKLLVQMAINNLVDNAMKYSSKGSVVKVSLQKKGDRLELSVKDEGRGIEAGEKKKIFDKFYRVAHAAAKGTGLGLYLTRKIMRQHNGSIFVSDNVPAGSCFTLSFHELPAGR